MTPASPRCAVFLDRDGVLTRAIVRDGKPYAPVSLEDFEILPGVADALTVLARAGLLLIVVTNQPDVGRGVLPLQVLEAMHRRLLATLPLDEIRVCYDPQSDGYKPKPRMLQDAARQHGIDLARSYMVGDRWRDVDAGKVVDCFTVLIDRGYDEPLRQSPDARCADLAEAAAVILNHLARHVHEEDASEG